MLNTIIIIYTIYIALKLYISVMQIGFISQAKKEPAVLMSDAKYQIAANYAVKNERVSIIETLLDGFIFVLWVTIGFAWVQNLVGIENSIQNSVLLLLGFFGLSYLIGIPFELYRKFKIDKEFGFNKATPKMYLIDTIKSTLMSIIFGGIIFAILSWIIINYQSWWLWGFALLFTISLLVNLIYPTIIAPIFNKFTPLDEGELRSAIEAMMSKVGLKSDGIFVMDASKRDSRLNAYFGGLGKSKRVVLYDTLLDKLNDQELLAVLGHELGHFKHGDIWKNIALVGVLLFTGFFIFGHLPNELFAQMRVVPTAGVKIAMLILLLPLLSFVFTPIMSFVSRHNEYAADEFGSQMGGKENLVSALMKLVTENKAFPKSHPLVIFFYHTHPPVLERLKELGYDLGDNMGK